MKTLDSLQLADIATRRVLGVTGDCPIVVAARRMGEMRVSCLVIMDGNLPAGIITERDLVQLLANRPARGELVTDVIRTPTVTAPTDLDFRSAYALLRRHGIRHLIAIDGSGTLAGVATATDFRLHLGLDRLHHTEDLRSVLDTVTASLPRDATLAEALEQMIREHWDYVLVVEREKPLGILTERDIPLLLAAEIDPGEVKLHEVMSTPVHTIAVAATLAEAAARMAKLRIRHIAVIDNNHHLVGMLSQDGLMQKLGIEICDDRPKHLGDASASAGFPLLHVLESTRTGALLYESSTDHLSLSSPMHRLLGYADDWQPAGLAGWLALIHPDDRSELPDYLRVPRGTANGRIDEGDYRLRAADGSWLGFHLRSVARHGADGKSLEVVAILTTSAD